MKTLITRNCVGCGGAFQIAPSHVKRNRGNFCSRSCATRRQSTKHGLCGLAEYRSWESMRQRCRNSAAKEYPGYGGRGISVCPRWDDFAAFYADMGARPAGTSLDRINNDGNYEPGNCRWATRREQSLNTSRNVRIAFKGESRVLDEWACLLGVSKRTLASRFRYGWSVERAFTEPVSMKYSHA